MKNLTEFNRKLKQLINFIKIDLPHIVGTEAINHYKQSFIDEGFTDKTLMKWQNVKRRDPSSKWYGFSPYTKKHFSVAATTRKILSGINAEGLYESINFKTEQDRIIIYSDKPYAKVHNEGGTAKIFGKKLFQMPKRQFIGKSYMLDEKIEKSITKKIDKILKP